MSEPTKREVFQSHLADIRAWRKAQKKSEIAVECACTSVKTCAVSNEATMKAGRGFCAKCSKLKYPNLYVAQE